MDPTWTRGENTLEMYDLQMLDVYSSHTVIDIVILACVKSLLVWAPDQ